MSLHLVNADMYTTVLLLVQLSIYAYVCCMH